MRYKHINLRRLSLSLQWRVSGRSGVHTFSLISTAGEEAIDNSVTRAVPGGPDRGERHRIGLVGHYWLSTDPLIVY